MSKHLIDLGYRKITIVDNPANVFTGLERLRGYQLALKDHDIAVNPEYIIQGNFARATGYEGAKRLLAMPDRPEAIFGSSDYITMGVFDAIEELGLKIPEDVALVGFDDTGFASNQRIRLTPYQPKTQRFQS
ncbi:substrate-binding domain-containing protein [Thermodesulfobacteriota bacterium]